MRSMSLAFFLGRPCSSPGSTESPTRLRPQWLATPIDQRRTALSATAARLFGKLERPVIRVALPDAPGAKVMLSRLASDWGAIGIQVEQAGPGKPADLRLIDAVAPSTSPAWYLRAFRCGTVAVCDPEADELLDDARAAAIVAQRNGLLDPGRATDGRTASFSSRWRLRSAGRSFRPECRASQPTASRGTL